MNTRDLKTSAHQLSLLSKLKQHGVPLAIAMVGLLVASIAWAADGASGVTKVLAVRSSSDPADAKADRAMESSAADSVEMFAAMKSGELDVKFIPKDDREARITIKNKSKRPLTVKLPAKFAAVPVLAQPGRNGGGMNGMMGGMNQGMGGGMGGGMMGGGGMGGGGMGGMGGGGMFNVPAEIVDDVNTVRIPAEKSANFKVATVCLDYGKRDPRPSIPYEMRPLESYTTKPGVAELLILLGNSRVGQRSAQAAAWHLANGVSWDHLAEKRLQSPWGDGGSYFSPDQIASGMQVAQVSFAVASNQADKRPAETKPTGDGSSLGSATAAPAESGKSNRPPAAKR